MPGVQSGLWTSNVTGAGDPDKKTLLTNIEGP